MNIILGNLKMPEMFVTGDYVYRNWLLTLCIKMGSEECVLWEKCIPFPLTFGEKMSKTQGRSSKCWIYWAAAWFVEWSYWSEKSEGLWSKLIMCSEEAHLPHVVKVALNRHEINQPHSCSRKASPFFSLGRTKRTKQASGRVNGVLLGLNCKWAAFSQGDWSQLKQVLKSIWLQDFLH